MAAPEWSTATDIVPSSRMGHHVGTKRCHTPDHPEGIRIQHGIAAARDGSLRPTHPRGKGEVDAHIAVIDQRRRRATLPKARKRGRIGTERSRVDASPVAAERDLAS